MCSSTKSTNKSRFHIQLLADRSVVLVNARGYESEIFLPVLQKGRVCLRNVIYSRQPKSPASEMSSQSSSSDHRCQRIRNIKLTTATAGLAPSPGKKVNTSRLRFELKLISNGKVVLVECNGYESEIFLPYICSRCVAMKHISANELAQCASARSNKSQCTQKTHNNSVAIQAVGLSSMWAAPPKSENVINKEKSGQRMQKSQQAKKMKKTQKDKSPTRQKKKRCKLYSKETRDVSN